MRNKFLTCTMCVSMLSFLYSCSIDKEYDLSKDVDMTVAVGKGISLPLGSTEKILLTEMIDPEESDVIKVDDYGFYSIYKDGTIDATTVKVEETIIEIDDVSEEEIYAMDIVDIDYENLDKYPTSVKEQILNTPHTHIMEEIVDKNDVEYTIDQEVPEEMTLLRRMTFDEPVKMSLDIDIFTIENTESDAKMLDRLHLHTDGKDGNDHFYVQMPDYMVFRDDAPVSADNKLWIDAVIEHDENKGHKHYTTDVYVEALDFSSYPDGGLAVINGRIKNETKLKMSGMIYSDPMTFTLGEIPELHDIHVKPTIKFDPFEIKSVEGYFEPEIDDVNEVIEIDLGEDMDFIYDATLDFTNPQIFVTLNNEGVTVPVKADIALSGYNKQGNAISGSNVNFGLDVVPDSENRYYITNSGAQFDGFTPISAELNNILREVPNEIKLTLQAKVDNSKGYNTVVLGEDMEVSGSYELNVPMEFNAIDLEYTETIEDVLGDDPTEITDYVTEIESITLEMEVDNTVPAKFIPSVIAKTAYGSVLNNVVATFDNEIAAGNGYENGSLTAPVSSSVKVVLSATNGELAELNTLDIVFRGVGSGVLNSNEYIKITKMSVTIDEPIIVDMN